MHVSVPNVNLPPDVCPRDVCPPRPAFDLVAIGVSLGGPDALKCILSGLPPDFPAPVVVVQHLAPGRRSVFCDLLRGHTRLGVQWAEDGERPRPGVVYVAPPDCHLRVGPDRAFTLTDGPRVNFSRPAVDPLFTSVADAYRARALGVVLTGRNQDGAAGLAAIKRAGGMTVAQDRATSRAFAMPQAAVQGDGVNLLLPLPKIAPALVSLVMVEWAATLFSVPASARYPLTA